MLCVRLCACFARVKLINVHLKKAEKFCVSQKEIVSSGNIFFDFFFFFFFLSTFFLFSFFKDCLLLNPFTC